MTDAVTYNVVIGEQLQAGFATDQVQQALAQLVKIPPEKAAALLSGRRTLKRNLDEATANLYKRKLESIGLIVSLEALMPAPATTPAGLSLAPIEPRHVEQAPAPQPTAKPAVIGTAAVQPAAATDNPTHDNETDDVGLTAKSLAAAAVVALIGALLWKFVATAFGYELGLIAWGIGGAIGTSMIFTESRGQAPALAAAALAMVSIIAGKYMIADDYRDILNNSLSTTEAQAELRSYFDEEVDAAHYYAALSGNESDLRLFLVEHGYSDADHEDDVLDSEIALFRSEIEPQLLALAYDEPDFDAWQQRNIDAIFTDVSTWDMFKAGFGALDILFLLLGVSTAFRLGKGSAS
jgi:hypothetical protein